MRPVLASHELKASDVSYASPSHTDMRNLRIYTAARFGRAAMEQETRLVRIASRAHGPQARISRYVARKVAGPGVLSDVSL